jgi:hypothetical protein
MRIGQNPNTHTTRRAMTHRDTPAGGGGSTLFGGKRVSTMHAYLRGTNIRTTPTTPLPPDLPTETTTTSSTATNHKVLVIATRPRAACVIKTQARGQGLSQSQGYRNPCCSQSPRLGTRGLRLSQPLINDLVISTKVVVQRLSQPGRGYRNPRVIATHAAASHRD